MARLKPLVIGRQRCNPAWIAKHYDSGNVQLIATDVIYDTYTPGIYEDENDTLEEGVDRKLGFAFESLRLKRGDSLLGVPPPRRAATGTSSRRRERAAGRVVSADNPRRPALCLGDRGSK